MSVQEEKKETQEENKTQSLKSSSKATTLVIAIPLICTAVFFCGAELIVFLGWVNQETLKPWTDRIGPFALLTCIGSIIMALKIAVEDKKKKKKHIQG